MSIKQPRINSITLIMPRMTYLLSEKPTKDAVTFMGICIKVMM